MPLRIDTTRVGDIGGFGVSDDVNGDAEGAPFSPVELDGGRTVWMDANDAENREESEENENCRPKILEARFGRLIGGFC